MGLFQVDNMIRRGGEIWVICVIVHLKLKILNSSVFAVLIAKSLCFERNYLINVYEFLNITEFWNHKHGLGLILIKQHDQKKKQKTVE